jgi:hypothetical protein
MRNSYVYSGGQNNGITKKLRDRFFFVFAKLKELQLATMNIFRFLYSVVLVSVE